MNTFQLWSLLRRRSAGRSDPQRLTSVLAVIAFAVTTAEGLDVLVHIGLDTVELKGEGFTVLAAQGQTVAAGQPVIEVDLSLLREKGRNPVTPVVMSNKKQVGSISLATGQVAQGDVTATVTLA